VIYLVFVICDLLIAYIKLHQFLFRLDWPLFRPAAGLTPETYINYQRVCCPAGATFSERSLGKSLGA
jgi:hypothetical protein